MIRLITPGNAPVWWRHQMGTFSALLALCEGNPSVTGGFPSQGPHSDVFQRLWCFLWYTSKQTGEQTIETLVIWDAIALIVIMVMVGQGHHGVCRLALGHQQRHLSRNKHWTTSGGGQPVTGSLVISMLLSGSTYHSDDAVRYTTQYH